MKLIVRKNLQCVEKLRKSRSLMCKALHTKKASLSFPQLKPKFFLYPYHFTVQSNKFRSAWHLRVGKVQSFVLYIGLNRVMDPQ